MIWRAMAVGAATLWLAGAAQAFSGDLGDLQTSPQPIAGPTLGLFPGTETLTFSLSAPSFASFTVQPESFWLIPPAVNLAMAVYKGSDLLAASGTSVANLFLEAGAGYSLKVSGSQIGVYSVHWSLVSAVPEPSRWLLGLLGFGALVPTMMRRRLER